MTREPLRKRLSYRLPITPGKEAAAVNSAAEVWTGVEWYAGPVIVAWVSESHGTIQVWAKDVKEGRRVIALALGHMEVEEIEGEWIETETSSPRQGRAARMRATVVSARATPSGVAPHRFLT